MSTDHAQSRGVAALGSAAAAGLLAAAAAIASGSADRGRWFFVPAIKHGGFPEWLAGPLHELEYVVVPRSGAQLLVAMFACYLVALACARTLSPRIAIGAIVLAHVAFLLAPPLFSADVFGYVDFARLDVLHGLDPYVHHSIDALHDPAFPYVGWHSISSPYGPLFSLASLPLAWLSVPAALWACKSLAAATSLACVALVWRIAQWRDVAPVPAIVMVGLNPLLLAYGVGGAHNDFLLLALLLSAILLALDGRSAAGGVGGAIAFGVKASAAVALPFLVLGAARRRSALAGVAAGGLAVLALGAIGFGSHAFAVVHQLGQQQQLVARTSVPGELAGVLGLADASGTRALLGAAFVVVFAGLVWATWRARIDWIAATGWTTLALLLSTAWLMPWYVVWLLPLAAVGRDRRLKVATLLLCGYVLATRVTYQLLGN